MKNKMATPLGTKVFFRKKEMMSQCNSQSAEPIAVENLVIHFDQEKFEELLSGGSPALHARKHRRVSVAKTPLATNQKVAPTEVVSKPMPAACTVKGTSLQFLSVSTEAKLTSCQHGGLCKASQVPREPRTAQSKQIWRAKPSASLREALCEVKAQPRLSREEKGKTLLSVDDVAYAASTQGTQSPLSREAKLDAQCRVGRAMQSWT